MRRGSRPRDSHLLPLREDHGAFCQIQCSPPVHCSGVQRNFWVRFPALQVRGVRKRVATGDTVEVEVPGHFRGQNTNNSS